MPKRPAEFQRSFRWKNSSCWLDSSLTVLFAAAGRNFPQMQTMFAALSPGHHLLQLRDIIGEHIKQASLPGREEGGCRILMDMRETFRHKLLKAKYVQHVGSSDALFVSTDSASTSGTANLDLTRGGCSRYWRR